MEYVGWAEKEVSFGIKSLDFSISTINIIYIYSNLYLFINIYLQKEYEDHCFEWRFETS